MPSRPRPAPAVWFSRSSACHQRRGPRGPGGQPRPGPHVRGPGAPPPSSRPPAAVRPGRSCASASTRPAVAPAPPAARSSRRAEKRSPQGTRAVDLPFEEPLPRRRRRRRGDWARRTSSRLPSPRSRTPDTTAGADAAVRCRSVERLPVREALRESRHAGDGPQRARQRPGSAPIGAPPFRHRGQDVTIRWATLDQRAGRVKLPATLGCYGSSSPVPEAGPARGHEIRAADS